MDTSLTIRLSKDQREALRRRAAAVGRTEAAYVRGLLAEKVERGFDYARVEHLIGSVRLDQSEAPRDAWADHLVTNNWRK